MVDGTLSLGDVGLLNIAIDIYDENTMRYSEALEKH